MEIATIRVSTHRLCTHDIKMSYGADLSDQFGKIGKIRCGREAALIKLGVDLRHAFNSDLSTV